MKAVRVLTGLISIMVTLPIWFYLIYQILVRVNASELMFFLFWVYVPFTILATVMAKMIEKDT